MLSRQNTKHPYYQGLFLETTDSNYLQETFLSYEPLFAPSDSFCCYPNTIVATSCVLQVFFRTGEDISSNDRLRLAVDKVIALGNMAHGICAGNIGARIKRMRKLEVGSKIGALIKTRLKTEAGGNIHQPIEIIRKLEHGHELWDRYDNVIFRRSSEENPGIPICAHIFLRAISYSTKLLYSAYTRKAIEAWKNHLLKNGNFETNYYHYNFYYALHTLRLFRKLPDIQQIFDRMIPAILRRQKKNGLWIRKDDWLAPTFTAVYALHQFGYLH